MTHKVFISYHHSNDQKKAEYLRTTYGDNNTLLDRSLDESYENMTDDEILAAIRQEAFKRFNSYHSVNWERNRE